jgi:hypothetical protein
MKPRHHLYLDDALSARLEDLARKGGSKSAVVAAALQAWLDRASEAEFESRLKVRLDKLSGALARIEREQQVLLESLGFLVRFLLMVIPPLPEAQQKEARAIGQDRFQGFIEQVGRRLADGKSLSRELQARGDGEARP